MNLGALVAEMAAAGLDVHSDRALAPLTTYGVGGNGACVVKVSSTDQVVAVSEILRSHPGVETLVMGRGSKVHGVVIPTKFQFALVRLFVNLDLNQCSFTVWNRRHDSNR